MTNFFFENVVLFCVMATMSTAAFGATKAIRAAKVVDGTGKTISNALILVDNDRIVSVGTAAPPAGAEVIDLSRFTIVPGLIDVHTHVTYYWDRAAGTRPLGQPRRPAGVTTVLASENARVCRSRTYTSTRWLRSSGTNIELDAKARMRPSGSVAEVYTVTGGIPRSMGRRRGFALPAPHVRW